MHNVATDEDFYYTYVPITFTDESILEVLEKNNSPLVGTPYTWEVSNNIAMVYDKDGVYVAKIGGDGSYDTRNWLSAWTNAQIYGN
jgi:hypothetical protein